MNRWMVTAMCVALLATTSLAEEERIVLGGQEFDVVGQALGNEDIIQIRVGLSEPNGLASWGLSVSHEPETALRNQHTSFGVFGMLSTPVQVFDPGALPGLWAGLKLEPFVDIDIMYDFDYSEINVWPGAGVLVAPTETMSFVARAFYALGDDKVPTAVEPDTWHYVLGLEIRF